MYGVKLVTGDYAYLISLSGNSIVPQPVFSTNPDFAMRVSKEEAVNLVKELKSHNFNVGWFQWT